MMKKLLSAILSVLLIVSALGVLTAFANDETEILGPGTGESTLPEVAEGCNRYFFYMPKSFTMSEIPGIYFENSNAASCTEPLNCADKDGVYFYDVPSSVGEISWSIYVSNGSADTAVFEEIKVSSVPYNSEEFELVDCDGRIFIVDLACYDYDEDDNMVLYGQWFCYYGDGEYGNTPVRGGGEIYNDSALNDVTFVPDVNDNLPEVAEGCNRYFFYMPEFWLNEYTDTAGIYWWEGTGAQASYPGLKANKADVEGVYYYDVPKDVEAIQWNNYMDLLLEDSESLGYMQMQSLNICSSSYDPEDRLIYPDGIENFDGMIYVISGIDMSINDYVFARLFFGGEWYYYYGNGEYGITPTRGDGEIYTDEVVIKDGFLLPPFAGDADENGVVNIKDVTHIQKLIAGMDVDDVWEPVGDVDDSGDINIKDATAIQKHLAGIETGYKIGKYVAYYNYI